MVKKQTVMVALLGTLAIVSPSFAQEGEGKPFQLGVQQSVQGAPASYPAYPVPTMIPTPPRVAPIQKPPKKKLQPLNVGLQQNSQPSRPLNAGLQQQNIQPPPMRAAVQNAPPGVLPQQFMGNWLVLGSRTKVDARPEYQSGVGNIFTSSNSQSWNIVGAPGGYSMSSTTGVQSVQVGNCNTTTAFLRYAHPVGNTVAEEAIVMQISADGQSFQGMQRITIKKQGEPGPRAQVTYSLMGRRQ